MTTIVTIMLSILRSQTNELIFDKNVPNTALTVATKHTAAYRNHIWHIIVILQSCYLRFYMIKTGSDCLMQTIYR